VADSSLSALHSAAAISCLKAAQRQLRTIATSIAAAEAAVTQLTSGTTDRASPRRLDFDALPGASWLSDCEDAAETTFRLETSHTAVHFWELVRWTQQGARVSESSAGEAAHMCPSPPPVVSAQVIVPCYADLCLHPDGVGDRSHHDSSLVPACQPAGVHDV
jgi:hypothetical protein